MPEKTKYLLGLAISMISFSGMVWLSFLKEDTSLITVSRCFFSTSFWIGLLLIFSKRPLYIFLSAISFWALFLFFLWLCFTLPVMTGLSVGELDRHPLVIFLALVILSMGIGIPFVLALRAFSK